MFRTLELDAACGVSAFLQLQSSLEDGVKRMVCDSGKETAEHSLRMCAALAESRCSESFGACLAGYPTCAYPQSCRKPSKKPGFQRNCSKAFGSYPVVAFPWTLWVWTRSRCPTAVSRGLAADAGSANVRPQEAEARPWPLTLRLALSLVAKAGGYVSL